MEKEIKFSVALVGGGTIAPLHAKYLLSSNSCELVAIIDPYPPGAKLAEQLSIPHFAAVSDLLASKCRIPDAYIICVPSGLHVSVALSILRLAQPKVLLVEKPFATDSASASELLAEAKTKGVKILVGHHRRFNAFLEAAKQTIVSGKLGQITTISGLWASKKNDGYFGVAKWRATKSGGGGPVWTNLVHEIDALHYLVDSRIKKVWVLQHGNQRIHDGVEDGDLVEEGAAILLQFENGVVGSFILSDNVPSPYNWEHATGENPLYPKAEVAVDTYRIFGTKGTLSTPDSILWTYDSQIPLGSGLEVGWNVPMLRTPLEVKTLIPFQEQTEHLGRLIAGIDKPSCSGADGLAAVQVCEAITKALRNGDGMPVLVN